MVKVEELNPEVVCRYRNEIAQFYYENIRTCSCFEHYSFNEAYEKIGDLINHLSSNTCIAYGAFEEKKIIGYIWAYLHPFREETRMYINEIRVREEYRNRGIGKELIRMVEERAKELNLPALYLHAEATNSDAIRLYESIGYKTERIQLRKEIM